VFVAMALEMLLEEVVRLENATKKRSVKRGGINDLLAFSAYCRIRKM